MAHHEHTVKKVCQCENCGNEAEMEITCRLEDSEDTSRTGDGGAKHPSPNGSPGSGQKVKGTATCSHCGSEADMWIDY